MKKTFKILISSLLAAAMLACSSVTVFADYIKEVKGVVYLYSDAGKSKGKYTGWANDKNNNWYYCKNGSYLVSQWLNTTDGNTYFFDKNGKMATGSWTIDGKNYTFNSDGTLKKTTSSSSSTSNSKQKDDAMKELKKQLNVLVGKSLSSACEVLDETSISYDYVQEGGKGKPIFKDNFKVQSISVSSTGFVTLTCKRVSWTNGIINVINSDKFDKTVSAIIKAKNVYDSFKKNNN